MMPKTLIIVLLVSLSGCSFSVDLEGKQCDPNGRCATGFQCVQGTCVEDNELGAEGRACRTFTPICNANLSCIQGLCQDPTFEPVDAGSFFEPPDTGIVDNEPPDGGVPPPRTDAGNPIVGRPDAGQPEECGYGGQGCCENNFCYDGLTCQEGQCACTVQLVSNEYQTCTLNGFGEAHCTGSNNHGQIGDGQAGAIRVAPSRVDLPEPATSLAYGAFHACAIAPNNLYCWGYDAHGQLGMGPGNISDIFAPTPVPEAPANILQMALGSFHTCARTADRQMWCWGRNDRQQIGPGSPPLDVRTPFLVDLPPGDLQDIATGAFHTCALVDGLVWCWGLNDDGQLGVGERFPNTDVPSLVQSLDGVIDIETGDWHTCALRFDGSLWCWGRNASGQLGFGAAGAPQSVPTRVSILGPPNVAVTGFATMDDHTCAIDASRSLFCWGNNDNGQLGNGNVTPPIASPALVVVAGPVLEVRGGRRHTCATTVDSNVICFGANAFGELGTGTTNQSEIPTQTLFTCP